MKRLLRFSGLGVMAGLAATGGLPSQATQMGAASPRSGSLTAARVVAYAKRFVGYPYATVGSSPSTGFSCIGFVWYVFETKGITVPGNLKKAYAAFPHVAEGDLMPGDLIFFQRTYAGLFPSHVGIFIGDGKMISAENFGTGVKISSLVNDSREGNYWQIHYLAAERPFTGETQSHPPKTNPVSHPSGPTAVVSVATGLNLRSDHSTKARIIRALPKGTAMTVVSHWGYWLKVSVADGTTGWVVKGGVKVGNGGSYRASFGATDDDRHGGDQRSACAQPAHGQRRGTYESQIWSAGRHLEPKVRMVRSQSQQPPPWLVG